MVVRAVLSLPAPAQRAIFGRPPQNEGTTLDSDAHGVLRLSQWARALSRQAKRAHSPETMRAEITHGMRLGGGEWPIGQTADFAVDGIPVRLYTPQALHRAATRPRSEADSVQPPAPLAIFFHGGGFVGGSIDDYDPVCRFLAEESGVRILSVGYRLAPEHPFPAAYEDAHAVFDWVYAHAAGLGVNKDAIALVGDSAGGNLAAGLALTARHRCAHQVLIYPGTAGRGDFASRTTFADGYLLTAELIDLAVTAYAGQRPADDYDLPAASPLYADIPSGVAPAHVITCGFDPLSDEGEAYARKLAAAGVDVTVTRIDNQIHGFLGSIGVSRSARLAASAIAHELSARLLDGPAYAEKPARSATPVVRLRNR